jgi:hypothetical protein
LCEVERDALLVFRLLRNHDPLRSDFGVPGSWEIGRHTAHGPLTEIDLPHCPICSVKMAGARGPATFVFHSGR